jgi:ferredoxin
MKVTVDVDTCIGAAQCMFVAPAVFESDEIGTARVIDGVDPAAHRDDVSAAAAQCPSGAIQLTDDGSADR